MIVTVWVLILLLQGDFAEGGEWGGGEGEGVKADETTEILPPLRGIGCINSSPAQNTHQAGQKACFQRRLGCIVSYSAVSTDAIEDLMQSIPSSVS